MSWRTVVISKRAKIDMQLNYLVVRGEETKKVYLSEIGVLIIETTAVSLTAALLSELTKRKIKVIFCDEKRNPCSELVSYYGSHDTSSKIRIQIKWKEDIKAKVWKEIVRDKILKQSELLIDNEKFEEANMLINYTHEIEDGDITNREGHAAKVYFNALFGKDFARNNDDEINAALNYGYAIILSIFNREISATGYLTQLGIFHDNMFNQFNLSCDLMEPFRILVDRCVKDMNIKEFDKDIKLKLINLINKELYIDGKIYYLDYAVKIYVRSVFEALNKENIFYLKSYSYEL